MIRGYSLRYSLIRLKRPPPVPKGPCECGHAKEGDAKGIRGKSTLAHVLSVLLSGRQESASSALRLQQELKPYGAGTSGLLHCIAGCGVCRVDEKA